MEDTRDPECVKQWPDCVEGEYNPMCCRFPKSCSCEVVSVRKEQDKTTTNMDKTATEEEALRHLRRILPMCNPKSKVDDERFLSAGAFVADNSKSQDLLHTLGLSIINKLKEQMELGPELGRAVGAVVSEFSKAGVVIDPLEIVKPTEQ